MTFNKLSSVFIRKYPIENIISDTFAVSGDINIKISFQNFADRVEKLRQKLAPSVKINTIGFWTQKTDRQILETVAERSGGQFVNVDW